MMWHFYVISDFVYTIFLTGHRAFPSFHAKMFVKSLTCTCEAADTDVEHIILEYNEWNFIRDEYFIPDWSVKTIKDLLCNSHSGFGLKLIMNNIFEKSIDLL